MNIDRKTDQILKHADMYRAFPIFQKMADGTIYITTEEKQQSARIVDGVYGTIAVDEAERTAHGA